MAAEDTDRADAATAILHLSRIRHAISSIATEVIATADVDPETATHIIYSHLLMRGRPLIPGWRCCHASYADLEE